MKKPSIILMLAIVLLLLVILSTAYASDIAVKTYKQQEQTEQDKKMGMWDFLNENSGGITAAATVLYFLATCWIIGSSRSQLKQLRKQHEQNIGVQLYDRRKFIYKQLEEQSYGQIDMTESKFLFQEATYLLLEQWRNKKHTLNVALDKLRSSTLPLYDLNVNYFNLYKQCLNKDGRKIPRQELQIEFFKILKKIESIPNIEKEIVDKVSSIGLNLIGMKYEVIELYDTTQLAMEIQIKGSIAAEGSANDRNEIP